MGPIEITITVIACVFVVGVVIASIVRKKKGKSTCCSDCSSCPYCSGCGSKENVQDKK